MHGDKYYFKCLHESWYSNCPSCALAPREQWYDSSISRFNGLKMLDKSEWLRRKGKVWRVEVDKSWEKRYSQDYKALRANMGRIADSYLFAKSTKTVWNNWIQKICLAKA